MNNCSTIQERFSDLYDGDLPGAERVAVEEHLGACLRCREDYEVYRASLTALETTGRVEAGEEFVTTVKTALAAELERGDLLQQTGLQEKPPELKIVYRMPRWVPAAMTLGILAGVWGGTQWGGRPETKTDKDTDTEKRDPAIVSTPPSTADVEKVAQLSEEVERRQSEIERLRRERDELRDRIRVLGSAPESTRLRELEQQVGLLERERDEAVEKLASATAEHLDEEWKRRLVAGEVMVAPGEFRTKEDLEADVRARHGLVEYEGRWITKEQMNEWAARREVRRPAEGAQTNVLTGLLDGIRIGLPVNFGALTLYPLSRESVGEAAPLQTLGAAMAVKKVVISDTVNPSEVRVENRSDQAIHVFAGEILTGGRCAKAAAVSRAVPAHQRVVIPVYCLEPDEWRAGKQMDAESGRYWATPLVMREVLMGYPQGSLWTAVHGDFGLDVLENYRTFGELEEMRRYYSAAFEKDPSMLGVVVGVGETLECAVIFGHPDAFRSCENQVYLSAALGVARGVRWKAEESDLLPNTLAGVQRFLENLFVAKSEPSVAGLRLLPESRLAGEVAVSGDRLVRAWVCPIQPFSRGAFDGGDLPKPKLNAMLRTWVKGYAAGDVKARTGVVREIRSIDSPVCASILRGWLAREHDAEVLVELIGGVKDLSRHDPEETTRQLLRILEWHRRDESLLIAASDALAEVGSPSAVAPLVKIIQTGDPAQVRAVTFTIPILMRKMNDTRAVETAIADLIEAAEREARREKAEPNRVGRSLPIVASLRRITGLNVIDPDGFRVWWNDRVERESFLKQWER